MENLKHYYFCYYQLLLRGYKHLKGVLFSTTKYQLTGCKE